MRMLLSIASILSVPLFIFMPDARFYEKLYFTLHGQTLPYRMLLPRRYDKTIAYPVIVLLHGIGERGNDNRAQLVHGGRWFASEAFRSSYQAIVIFPQCAQDSTWSRFSTKADPSGISGQSIGFTFTDPPATPSLLVKELLDSLVKAHRADPRRMYLMGLSMGGFGTLDLIARYPQFFAAAVCICGGGDVTAAGLAAKHVAVWLFHGRRDKTVEVRYSRQYYDALKKAGADVRYTEYPKAGHDCWYSVFKEKDLMPWLFSKVKQ